MEPRYPHLYARRFRRKNKGNAWPGSQHGASLRRLYKYHLGKAYEQKISTAEVYEVFAVANMVGGSIVIPHTRRAAEYWEALQESHLPD